MVTSVESESQVPTYKSEPSVGQLRNEAEAKRRLQQHQRDMIVQTAFARNGGNINAVAWSAKSSRDRDFPNMEFKPSKPRPTPLDSPGSVTPMELENSNDSYLGARLIASENST